MTCLASRTFRVCVCTTIPSSTVCMQDVAKPFLPSTSTTHILQSPTSFISFKKQSVGMSIPASFAACNIVVPFFTFTSCPSILSFTNSFSTIFSPFKLDFEKSISYCFKWATCYTSSALNTFILIYCSSFSCFSFNCSNRAISLT